MSVTVKREDIELVEEVDEEAVTFTEVSYTWAAGLDGRLSSGERVSLGRSGYNTPDAALQAIEAAIRANGWKIT